MTLPPAIAKSLEILRLQQGLGGRPEVDLEDTIRRLVGVFEELGVEWALVGAHAVNLFGRPRATVDVDFIVDARRMGSILAAVRLAFGEIETVEMGAALRITSLSVDLIRSDNHPLFREALDRAEEREGWRVPPPEVLTVLKFLAAVSPWRNAADRQQDAADLIRIYQAVGESFNRDLAVSLSDRAYPGAENDFRALLDRIDRGERPTF